MKNRLQYIAVVFLVSLIGWTSAIVPSLSYRAQPVVSVNTQVPCEVGPQKISTSVLSDQTAQLTVKSQHETAPTVQLDPTCIPSVPGDQILLLPAGPAEVAGQTKTLFFQQHIRALLYPHHSFS